MNLFILVVFKSSPTSPLPSSRADPPAGPSLSLCFLGAFSPLLSARSDVCPHVDSVAEASVSNKGWVCPPPWGRPGSRAGPPRPPREASYRTSVWTRGPGRPRGLERRCSAHPRPAPESPSGLRCPSPGSSGRDSLGDLGRICASASPPVRGGGQARWSSGDSLGLRPCWGGLVGSARIGA